KDWINAAIVGCGHIYNDGHREAYPHKLTNNIAVIGICDLREDLANAQFEWLKDKYEKRLKDFQKKNDTKNIERLKYALERLKVYTSFDQMLDELEGDLDLVDNCTPGRTHVQLAMQAME